MKLIQVTGLFEKFFHFQNFPSCSHCLEDSCLVCLAQWNMMEKHMWQSGNYTPFYNLMLCEKAQVKRNVASQSIFLKEITSSMTESIEE
jgi:hypothetical protein